MSPLPANQSGWRTIPSSRATSRANSPIRGTTRRRPAEPIEHAKLKGTTIVAATWLFVCIAVWALLPWEREPEEFFASYERSTGWPIRRYLPAQVLMSSVAVWFWALLAWLGMKLMRHAPSAPPK